MNSFARRGTSVLSTLLALAALALSPLTALADDELDDLDVTMQVLDDETELREFVAEMRGPSTSGIDEALADSDLDDGTGATADLDAEVPDDESPFGDEESAGDGFDRDIVLPEERLPHEDDFASDEGEDLDFDLLPEDDYFPADDEDDL